MIIRNNFNMNETNNCIQEEKNGIQKAVEKLDQRFQNNEISREKFLKQNEAFAKRQQELTKRMNKLNRK